MKYHQSAYDKLRSYKEEVKERIFDKIFTSVSFSKIDLDNAELARQELERIARKEIESMHMSYYEKHKIVEEILEDVFGFGPLEPLLANSGISDILVNGVSDVFIDVGGKLEKTPVYFRSKEHLLHIIRKLVGSAGRRIDESVPIVDAFLPDGSRVNAVIPPIVAEPSLSIRKFVPTYSSLELLAKQGSFTTGMAEFVKLCVMAKLNILVSGATGSGKTTLLNALAHYIPDNERVVTIEDSMELDIKKPDVVRMVTRQANVEGKGRVTQRDLVVNALRMRPDRIVVGEVRSSEVWDMLTAMNTGHAGSLTTVHANSPHDALYRLETMAMLSGYEVSERTLSTIISRSIDLVVQLNRFAGGERKMVAVSEVDLGDDGRYRVRDLFRFIPGEMYEGRITGRFKSMVNTVSERLAEKSAMTGVSPEQMNAHLAMKEV